MNCCYDVYYYHYCYPLWIFQRSGQRVRTFPSRNNLFKWWVRLACADSFNVAESEVPYTFSTNANEEDQLSICIDQEGINLYATTTEYIKDNIIIYSK